MISSGDMTKISPEEMIASRASIAYCDNILVADQKMVQDSPSRKLEQYIVRFPDGMRERLKEVAAKNGRSLNAEIIARLSQSLELEQNTPGAFGQKVADLIKGSEGVLTLDLEKFIRDTERDREAIKETLEDIRFHREELRSMQNELSQKIFEMRREETEKQRDFNIKK